MDVSTLGGWLAAAGIVAVQATMLYGFGRLLWVGGGIQLPNPFQKGWSHLYAMYGTSVAMKGMPSGSARIGMVTYKNTVAIGLDAEAVCIRKDFLSTQIIRIPYADFTLVRPPKHTTVLLLPVHTDGLFKVAGVEIGLKASVAEKIIDRITPPDAILTAGK